MAFLTNFRINQCISRAWCRAGPRPYAPHQIGPAQAASHEQGFGSENVFSEEFDLTVLAGGAAGHCVMLGPARATQEFP